MIYFLLIPLGFLPSVIWLLFYLRKDAHPESKRMIVKIFFYGMLAAIIAAIIEVEISFVLGFFGSGFIKYLPFLFFLFYQFIIVALTEELSKFLIVKEKIINNPEFDEPVDLMIYMIVTALGFAALENILVLFSGQQPALLSDAIVVVSLRFLGATFLHALCSGILGYFLARSFLAPAKSSKIIIFGVLLACFLHGLFNLSIIEIEKGLNSGNSFLLFGAIAFLVFLLICLAFFVSFGFKKLKEAASVCELE